VNIPTGVLLGVAAVAIVAGLLASRPDARFWLAAMLLAGAAAAWAAVRILGSGVEWDWRSALVVGGEPLHLRLDGLSALFLLLLCVVGAAGSVYALEYWPERAHPRSAPAGRLWWSAMIAGLAIVLLASNGLHFLIGWELFTLAAYLLITLDRTRPAARAAAWLYLAASHAAVLALFAFFALLAARTGSWDLGPMREQAALAPLFWLLLFGCGIKAGVFPLHIWLPSAHANAPSHVSAMLSGVSLKIGIYGLIRFSGWMPLPSGTGWVVAVLGVASALLGVAFALGQHDLKRLLAYHSVENIGIILIGFGFALVAAEQGHPLWGQLALAGAFLHVWNHGLFKSLLFLGAGSVLHATDTREMSQLGGLWRRMPWTTALFGLGALAICGLPPLNGFVSEWLVYLGLFEAAVSRGSVTWIAIPATVLLAVTGALALACFVKACSVVFLGAPRSAATARARESGWRMRGAMLVLAAACVTTGLAPVLFWPALASAIVAWRPVWVNTASPAPLAALGMTNVAIAVAATGASVLLLRRTRRRALRHAVTWDCAYAAPTPRMQYTAGSFAALITRWFAFILRPDRRVALPDGPLPRAAHLTEHTPETVLRYVIEPMGAAVLRLARAARGLQHGRVQSYLLYILTGLILLVGVVLFGGGS